MKNKIPSFIVTGALVVSLIIVFSFGSQQEAQVDNVEIRDGVQYVTIKAQGGYFPRATQAQPGIPTSIIMTTNGTYDCSTWLSIRSIGFDTILEPTGEKYIDIGTPDEGEIIRGQCSMGMYHFSIAF